LFQDVQEFDALDEFAHELDDADLLVVVDEAHDLRRLEVNKCFDLVPNFGLRHFLLGGRLQVDSFDCTELFVGGVQIATFVDVSKGAFA